MGSHLDFKWNSEKLFLLLLETISQRPAGSGRMSCITIFCLLHSEVMNVFNLNLYIVVIPTSIVGIK